MKILNEWTEERNTTTRQFDNAKKHKDIDVVMNPVMADAIETSKQNIKAAADALKYNIKAAEDLAAYNEKEGPGKTEIEKMKFELNESLFESVQSNVDYIIKALDNVRDQMDLEDIVPTRKDFKAAFKKFLKNATLDEELSQERQWDFNSDFYNAVAKVCFKYRNDNVTENDLEQAWDWFMIHFNDNDLFEESLNEARDDDTLYIIKDRHGNQVSSPNKDDQELWDRVADRDPDGRKGLHVVVLTESKDDDKEDKCKLTVIKRDENENIIKEEEFSSKKSLLKRIESYKQDPKATTIEVKAPKYFKDVCYFAIRDDENSPWDVDVDKIDLAFNICSFESGPVEAIYTELSGNSDPGDRAKWLISDKEIKVADRFDSEDFGSIDVGTEGKVKVKLRDGREDKDKEVIRKIADAFDAKVSFTKDYGTISYKDKY